MGSASSAARSAEKREAAKEAAAEAAAKAGAEAKRLSALGGDKLRAGVAALSGLRHRGAGPSVGAMPSHATRPSASHISGGGGGSGSSGGAGRGSGLFAGSDGFRTSSSSTRASAPSAADAFPARTSSIPTAGRPGASELLHSLAEREESTWKVSEMKAALAEGGVSIEGVTEKEELRQVLSYSALQPAQPLHCPSI